MHHQYVNREFLLVILAFPIILCLSFITQTPTMLVMLASFIVIIGILGLFNCRFLPYPWLVGLGSIVIIALGAAFMVWFFFVGRTILHPILDVQKHFETIQESLVTPTP